MFLIIHAYALENWFTLVLELLIFYVSYLIIDRTADDEFFLKWLTVGTKRLTSRQEQVVLILESINFPCNPFCFQFRFNSHIQSILMLVDLYIYSIILINFQVSFYISFYYNLVPTLFCEHQIKSQQSKGVLCSNEDQNSFQHHSILRVHKNPSKYDGTILPQFEL